MSKANGFLKEEDAVSPVIGVILMVAITVILAAVIAAFVFGMGPPETAPQSSVRGSAIDVGTNNSIKLEHQGGDGMTMTSTATKITVDGNSVTYDTTGYDAQFDAGETQYVYRTSAGYFITNDSTATILGLSPIDVVAAGATSNVKVIDVASQQMIADLDVRF